MFPLFFIYREQIDELLVKAASSIRRAAPDLPESVCFELIKDLCFGGLGLPEQTGAHSETCRLTPPVPAQLGSTRLRF